MTSTRVIRATPEMVKLYDDADPELVEEHGLVFDANVMSEIEEAFDGMDGWARAMGEAGEVSDVDGTLAELEEAFERNDAHAAVWAQVDAMAGEVKQLREKIEGGPSPHVFASVRKTLSIALGIPEREVGKRMLPGLPQYATAIGRAFALANGMDPTKLDELPDDGDAGDGASSGPGLSVPTGTPGMPGLARGAVPAGLSTSSGD